MGGLIIRRAGSPRRPAARVEKGHRLAVAAPAGGEFLLPPGAQADLPPLAPDHALGLKRLSPWRPGAKSVFTVPAACGGVFGP
ncbi:MAG: hypothetical protein NTU94_12260 [Planctomycetota bacterium]|nr:hypothetical protein [Planctomycetota bacterium]